MRREAEGGMAKMAFEKMDDATTFRMMAAIFATMGSVLLLSSRLLTRTKRRAKRPAGVASNVSKREGERWSLGLAALWITAVVVVIVTQAYEWWGSSGYMAIGLFCALPYVSLPYLMPSAQESEIPWRERYITKANVWVAIFSFIGNYWYTHYFYRVLKVSHAF